MIKLDKSIFNKEYRKKSDDLWDNFFEPLIESVKKEKVNEKFDNHHHKKSIQNNCGCWYCECGVCLGE